MRGQWVWVTHITIYIIASLAYLLTYVLPSSSQISGGDIASYTFPRIIIITILIFNTMSLISTIRNKIKSAEKVSNNKLFTYKRDNFKIAFLITLMVAYIIILPLVGYMISTGILLIIMMLIYNVRNYKLLTFVPVGIIGVLFIVFENLLKIPLP